MVYVTEKTERLFTLGDLTELQFNCLRVAMEHMDFEAPEFVIAQTQLRQVFSAVAGSIPKEIAKPLPRWK